MFPKQATRQVAQGLLKVSAMRDKTKMKANLTKGLLVFAYLGLANAVSLESSSRQELAIDTTTDGTLDIAAEGGSAIIPCSCSTCPTCACTPNPCTSMQSCLSITGCGNPCELPPLTPYSFQECTTCGGDSCVETTHADEFCLSGTHQEGFADNASFTEAISEGSA